MTKFKATGYARLPQWECCNCGEQIPEGADTANHVCNFKEDRKIGMSPALGAPYDGPPQAIPREWVDAAILKNQAFKADVGKPLAALPFQDFPRALAEIAGVGTFGAAKYARHSWGKVDNGLERYTDAMMRHLMADMGGEELDPETNLKHYAHFAWNVLATFELMLTKYDRLPRYASSLPVRGPSPATINFDVPYGKRK